MMTRPTRPKPESAPIRQHNADGTRQFHKLGLSLAFDPAAN
jgi:hypothetical protein